MYTHVCKTAKRWVDSGVKFLKNVDWKKVGVTVGAIGVGIALTVATEVSEHQPLWPLVERLQALSFQATMVILLVSVAGN